ncbi:MAG: hypothetical protein KAH33_01950, partial [Candidatus Delongbacteria bacterium]|nr:hypothetical protein [Candidatus Delongbacteria bacterium]
MKLINKVRFSILITFFITSCAITPASEGNKRVGNADFKQVEIPDVGTDYQPKLNKEIEKKKSVIVSSYTLEDIKVSKKKNGILIKFKYDGEDPKENISTFF